MRHHIDERRFPHTARTEEHQVMASIFELCQARRFVDVEVAFSADGGEIGDAVEILMTSGLSQPDGKRPTE